MGHSLENCMYCRSLRFKHYIHRNRKCRFLISTNHINDPRFEKEAWGNSTEGAGAPIEAGTGRTHVESQA